MSANPRFDGSRFRAPSDDAVGVLLEEGIGCKLAGLPAGSVEEIAVDVIGDAGRFEAPRLQKDRTLPAQARRRLREEGRRRGDGEGKLIAS